jgi:hypothetical protein
MAIPIKRGDKRLVHYLSRDEVKALTCRFAEDVSAAGECHLYTLTLGESEKAPCESVSPRF